MNMVDAKITGQTFDRIAEHFDKTRSRPWSEVLDFLESNSGRLLDIGCGNGRHLLAAKEMGYEVVGLDASKKLLEITKNKTDLTMELVRGDVLRLPFKERCFDTVIYIAVIHHLKIGRKESLREALRVLKPGGRIIISAWAIEQKRWETEEKDVMVPWHLEGGDVVDRYYHLYSLEELVEDVKASGLYVEKYYHSRGNNYVEARKL